MNSMINSYLNLVKNRQETNNARQPYLQQQDALRTHVTAYKPLGKLIEPDTLGIKSAVRNDINSIKYFVNGIQGKGNDYSVGRINDIAIKLGSLGIAGVLATTKGAPRAKGMEFVGLASWFGAMSLWPKLAIHTPIKIFKGVDLGLEYETASGRRKSFYEDPQFICWDLISDEKINKMGDKLGIPRNINNRRKAVENKARQIAIQGNTLALLTAGFATPLVASLAADALSKTAISPMLEKYHDKKTEKLSRKMLAEYKKTIVEQTDIDFIKNNLTKESTTESRNAITKFLTDKLPLEGNKKAIEKTIQNIFENAKKTDTTIDLTDKHAQNVIDALFNAVPERYTQSLSREELINELKDLGKQYGAKVSDNVAKDFGTELSYYLYDAEQIVEQASLRISKDFQKAQKAAFKALENAQTYHLANPEATSQQLQKLAELTNTFDKLMTKNWNNYIRQTMIYDTSTISRLWENSRADLLKAFDFNLSEIRNMESRDDNRYISEMLNKKIKHIITNENKYQNAIKKLSKAAQKAYEKTNKNIDFSLEYLDNVQKTLNSEAYGSALKDISEFFAMQVANERKYVLSKYMSTNGAMFAPIRVLNAMKNAADRTDINPDVLKQLVLNSQTVDSFINKLEPLKNQITNQNEFNKYIELVFSPLNKEIQDILSPELTKEINKNSDLMKAMLPKLSDDVNFRFGAVIDNNQTLNAVKNSKFAKYIDEYFRMSFNNADDIANKVKDTLRENSSRLDELKTFLKLSDETTEAVKNGNIDAITGEIKAYLEKGSYRVKNLCEFLGESAKNVIFENMNLSKTTNISTSSVIPPTLTELVKDSALKVAPNKTWVKRIGLCFIALCAVTGYALTKIGKRNEFNPDIYSKKGNA